MPRPVAFAAAVSLAMITAMRDSGPGRARR